MEKKKKPIQVIPEIGEYKVLKRAAELTKRSLASFVLYAGLKEAREINEAEAK